MLRKVFPLVMLAGLFCQAEDFGIEIVKAANEQIGVTLRYDSRYQRIGYPGGDLPLDRGVCTDVIIRTYRKFGVDLQVLVHKDMLAAWAEYPNPWKAKSTDTNIDHRRVPNLAAFFKRHGITLSNEKNPGAFLPGDIVTWRLTSGVPHIGIVSNQFATSGVPLVVHNIGWGTMLEDRLFDFKITGHYRYLPEGLTKRSTRTQPLPSTRPQ